MADKGTVYVSKAARETKKLDKLAQKTDDVIYEISSVFPFQLFPDRIIIDENKVTIVRKDLLSKRVIPIMYKDILSVKVNRGIMFAALEFEVRRFDQNPRPVTHLWPGEATTAQSYAMGLIEARLAKVDLPRVPMKKKLEKLEEVGKGQDENESLF